MGPGEGDSHYVNGHHITTMIFVVKLIRCTLSIPSVVGCIFMFILLIICLFHIASETRVVIEIVQTLVIDLLTSIYLS